MKESSQCKMTFLGCFLTQTSEDYLQERVITKHMDIKLNYKLLHIYQDRSWAIISYIYSWLWRSSTDISKISNPALLCYTWTFLWRRKNISCYNEPSILYDLFLRNIFRFLNVKSSNSPISFLVIFHRNFPMSVASKFFYL